MLFLVDGHNLIPKVGLRLDSMDDEEALIQRLQEYCRLRRASMEVYFDGAPPGQTVKRTAGTVTAYFIRQGSSADAALEARLARLGRRARNCIVVSSDRRVQQSARAAHAHVESSEEFALQMSRLPSTLASTGKGEATLAPEEVEEWLKEFDRKRGHQQ